MSKFFIINLLLLMTLTFEITTACATMVEMHYRVVDTELQPYVNDYYELLKKYCKKGVYNKTPHYIIYLGSDLSSQGLAGVCNYKLEGFSIEIDQNFWNYNKNQSDRRELMYHELAHCLINKRHVKSTLNYMNPSFHYIDEQTYTDQAIQDIKDYCK